MKMKVSDRILIALYALMGAIALVILGVCTVAPDMAEMLGLAMKNALMNSLLVQILSVLLVIVLLACSVRIVMAALQKGGSALSSSATIQESVNGAVRVSVRAMETLVRRAVDQTDGILESKLRINNHDDSVTVEIDAVIGIETHVPAMTAILQRNVKGIVEEFSGIAVREVVVLVTEIRDNAPPALPAPKEECAQTVVVEPEKVEVKTVEEEPAAETAAEEDSPAAADPQEEAQEPSAEAGPEEEAAEENSEETSEETSGEEPEAREEAQEQTAEA